MSYYLNYIHKKTSLYEHPQFNYVVLINTISLR